MQNPFGQPKIEDLTGKVNKEEEARVIEETKDIKEEINSMLTGIDEAPIIKAAPKSRKQAILDSYGGLESNVPINSAYWRR